MVSLHISTRIFSQRRVWLTVVFALAGMAVNSVAFPLFYGLDFVFGGIFSLAPAMWYGPWHGAVAGLIAGLPTLLHWHHPYAALVFGLEGLVVGWLMTRRNQPLTAELKFWLFVGAPTLFVTYYFVLNLPLQAVLAVTFKQIVNALLNVVVCTMWVYLTAGGRQPRGQQQALPLRIYLTQVLTLLVIASVVVGSISFGKFFSGHTQQAVSESTVQTGATVLTVMNHWRADHIEPETLDLDHLQTQLTSAISSRDATVLLLDPYEQVVVSTAPAWKRLDQFGLSTTHSISHVGSDVDIMLPKGLSTIERWLKGYVVWRGSTVPVGWSAVVLIPLAPYITALFRSLAVAMATGFVLVLLAFVLSRWISGLLTRPLERVAVAAQDGDGIIAVIWPAFGPISEVNALISSLSSASDKLREMLTERTRAETRLSLLAEASSLLSGSLDYHQSVDQLVQLLVPQYFDLCQVDLRQQAERPTEVMGLTSALVIPLIGRERTLGTMTFGFNGAARPYSIYDRELAHELARRTALAIDNALLYAQSKHAALHDPLTGLPNRSLFMQHLSVAMGADGRRAESPCAVLFIDMDGFKLVNDSLGHVVGDHLLAAVCKRLSSQVGSNGVCARLGGDEFAVLLPAVRDLEEAVTITREIIAEIEVPLRIDGHELYSKASVGIALGSDATDAEEVLRFADIAMYQAKQDESRKWVTFTPAMNARAQWRLQMVSDLHRSLAREEFELHYQPKVDLQTGHMIGMEALVRWRHPEQGIVSPGDFIPVAEDTGLIIPLGTWLLREACRQARCWRERFPAHADLKLSVNLSVKQLHAPRMVETVAEVLAESGFPAAALQLEITESATMNGAENMIEVLAQLKALGVSLAIDDFGTGYSSLSYLKRFPIDEIKVDRSFVVRLPDDEELVRTILALGTGLNLQVVAEGIETELQREVLLHLGFSVGQGFLFSRPLPAPFFEQLLAENVRLVTLPEVS